MLHCALSACSSFGPTAPTSACNAKDARTRSQSSRRATVSLFRKTSNSASQDATARLFRREKLNGSSLRMTVMSPSACAAAIPSRQSGACEPLSTTITCNRSFGQSVVLSELEAGAKQMPAISRWDDDRHFWLGQRQRARRERQRFPRRVGAQGADARDMGDIPGPELPREISERNSPAARQRRRPGPAQPGVAQVDCHGTVHQPPLLGQQGRPGGGLEPVVNRSPVRTHHHLVAMRDDPAFVERGLQQPGTLWRGQASPHQQDRLGWRGRVRIEGNDLDPLDPDSFPGLSRPGRPECDADRPHPHQRTTGRREPAQDRPVGSRDAPRRKGCRADRRPLHHARRSRGRRYGSARTAGARPRWPVAGPPAGCLAAHRFS